MLHREVPPRAMGKVRMPRTFFKNRQRKQSRDIWIGVVSILMFFGIWQLVVSMGWINAFVLSPPSAIVEAFGQVVGSHSFGKDLRVSGVEFMIGYLAAVVVGITVGVAIGWYRGVSAALQPLVSGLYATPLIALMPLFVVWLGVGIWSKVAIIFGQAVFQILLNTAAGVRAADETLLTAGRSFGATDSQLFRTIVLPGAVPFLLAGLRLGVGTGIIGVAVGQMLAATSGIGYMIAVAGQTFKISEVFVGVIILAATSAILMGALQKAEQHYQSWKPSR